MKKTLERRSMTVALVQYARLGVSGCGTPFDIYKRIEGACGKNTSLSLDIWAVHECLLFLRVSGELDILDALNEIYIKPFAKAPHRAIRAKEISYAILSYAQSRYIDERTVYRRLSKARTLWLALREKQK